MRVHRIARSVLRGGPRVGERIDAREVHAEKPIRAASPARSVAHPGVVAVFFEVRKALSDRRGVDGRDPEALHGKARSEVFEHFVDQKLPLAIGVAGVHDHRSLFQELPDFRELRRRPFLSFREHLPGFRKDREVFEAPGFFAAFGRRGRRQVRVGLRLLQKVPEAPGDDRVTAADESALFTAQDAELGGDRAGDGRLFGDVEDMGHGGGNPSEKRPVRQRDKRDERRKINTKFVARSFGDCTRVRGETTRLGYLLIPSKGFPKARAGANGLNFPPDPIIGR